MHCGDPRRLRGSDSIIRPGTIIDDIVFVVRDWSPIMLFLCRVLGKHYLPLAAIALYDVGLIAEAVALEDGLG